MLYMHARHYSPALGRFLQPDPDASEANLYAYSANSPVTEMDPDGSCFILCVVIVGILLFGSLTASAEVARYAMTTPSKEWRAEEARDVAVGGFIDGGLMAVPIPAGRFARLGFGLLTKIPKAARIAAKASEVMSRGSLNVLMRYPRLLNPDPPKRAG